VKAIVHYKYRSPGVLQYEEIEKPARSGKIVITVVDSDKT
jgi:hypothetical protein